MTKEPPRGSARAGDEAAIARGEKALPEMIWVLDAQLAKGKWLLGRRLHPGGMRVWPGAQRGGESWLRVQLAQGACIPRRDPCSLAQACRGELKVEPSGVDTSRKPRVEGCRIS